LVFDYPRFAVATTGIGISNTFGYASSGEMTSFTTPLGGTLGWTYRSFLYSGGVTVRELQNRTVSAVAGSSNSVSFGHSDSEDTNPPGLHAWISIYDSGAQSTKFYSSGVISANNLVAPTAYEEWNPDSSVNLHKDFAWTADSAGNAYMGQVTTTMNPGAAYAVTSKSAQTMDAYGNLTQAFVYDYGNLSTAARTYNFTYAYQQDSNYAVKYLFNRQTLATVTASSGTTTLSGASYDQSALQDAGNSGYLRNHDSTFDVSTHYRGNPTSTWQAGTSMTYLYQTTGIPYQMTNGYGVVVTTAPSNDTNWSLPGVLTPNSNSNLATSVSYATSFAVTSVTGPNGATGNATYDLYGRPTSNTSTDGAVTNYTYSYLPNTQTATITNGSGTIWKKTTLDGFGRTIKVETGHDSTTVSVSEMQYAPCACSPLGKLWRTSVPYAPGQTPLWTTNTYDGSGRTLTVVKPDGASTTRYLYQGNTTRVTDPAGKWKLFTNDAMGNLASVTEPDPNNQPNGTTVTSYTYNAMNQLTGVSMPRMTTGGSYTQTRSFAWSGADLTSSTNPENGTVTYQYDGSHHVTQRTDAKNQQTRYAYDSYGRLSTVQHYVWNTYYFADHTPYQQLDNVTGQDVNYYYDYPMLPGAQNTWGRLSGVTFNATSAPNDSGGTITVPGSAEYHWYYATGGALPGSVDVLLNNLGDNWNVWVVSGSWLSAGKKSYTNNTITISPIESALSSMSTGKYTGTVAVQNSTGDLTYITVDLAVNTFAQYPSAYYYSYNQAGRVTKQRLHITNPMTDFDASYAWDNQGRMTSQTYPGSAGYSYQYDSMGNLSSIPGVATASYNFAGQLTNLNYGVSETRTYDGQLRLTSIVTGTMLNESYVYSTTADNGRITSTVNGLSGETITYSYDAINRLASATSSNGGWSQQYTYDGFGNLTGTNGAAIWSFDPATNRSTLGTTDANGLPNTVQTYPYAWDVENRLTGSMGVGYGYDHAGKRITKSNSYEDGNGNVHVETTVYFYGITGQKLQTYQCNVVGGQSQGCLLQGTNVYFGRKLIVANGSPVATDRLGSVRYSGGQRISYYPYGQERPQTNGQTTADGTDKFGTYFRDGVGQDYADQRYYNQAGRFFSPDPGGLSTADPGDPGSWNRYTYAGADPMNRYDPEGLFYAIAPQPVPGPQTGYNPTTTTSNVSSFPGGTGGKDMAEPELPGDDDEVVGGGRSPCSFSAQDLQKYMLNTAAWRADGSSIETGVASRPLAAFAEEIMFDAVQDDVDPRLLVAIAFVEGKWGADRDAASTDNSFGLHNGRGKLANFTNAGQWGAGIQEAADVLNKMLGNGLNTVSLLYGAQPGSYCQGSSCKGFKSPIVSDKLKAMGGNPGSLNSPCYYDKDTKLYYAK
jgi:RHS repeat-associated protein